MATPWLQGNLSETIKGDPNFSSKSHLIVKDILSNKVTVVQFVEQLDGALTDLSPDIRKRGTQVLSDILKGLPSDFLSEEELSFISTFYSYRLKDQHEVLPAVFQGILAVCKMDNLPKTSPFNFCSTFFMHVNSQSQVHADRHTIYEIINLMTTKHLQSVKVMGPDLVFGVISSMDGERDPRNLMYLFNMLPTFLKNMPPGHLTEEAFEVIACYFPVDFNPLREDPMGITREDLAKALALCLTAIPEFAEFCLPLLLEKLDSELRLGKLDSLHLLEEAALRFSAESLSTHLSALWFSISREALRGSDREIREAAQSSLVAVLRNLATAPVDSEGKNDHMRLLLGDVVSACLGSLAEVQTTLFLPASQLLVAAARACSATCYIVSKKVLPLLLSYFLGKEDPTEKVVLLQTITILLATCQSLEVTPKEFPELQSDWTSIAEAYLLCSKHQDRGLQQEALEGLTTLLPSLDPQHRTNLCQVLKFLIDKEESFDTRDTMYSCLTLMAKLYPEEVTNNIVTPLMAYEDCNERTYESRMLAMCRLATVESFSLPILTGVVSSIVGSAECEPKRRACLRSLRNLLDAVRHDELVREKIHKYLVDDCCIISKLIQWWINGLSQEEVPQIYLDVEVLDTSSLVLAHITTHLTAQEQQQNIHIIQPISDSSSDFSPLRPDCPVYQTRTVCLLESVLGTLRPSVEIPDSINTFHKVLNLGLRTGDGFTRCSAFRLCASLVNKAENEETVDSMLTVAKSEIDAAVTSGDTTNQIKATAALSWILKALVMRGHKESATWTDKLIQLLSVPSNEEEMQVSGPDGFGEQSTGCDGSYLASSVGYEAASAFNLILQDSPVYLNPQSHCHVKLLYKQRFFQVAPTLAAAFSTAPENVRKNYLIALAYLLQGVPKVVLTANLPQIMPLLLESLSNKHTLLLLAVLNTLESLLPEKMHHDILSSHLQTMLPRLLPLTVLPMPMKVRIAALKCLKELCSFPLPLILPFKDEVVNDLKTCLNDPKRLVRKEAVKTRSQWIMCDFSDE